MGVRLRREKTDTKYGYQIKWRLTGEGVKQKTGNAYNRRAQREGRFERGFFSRGMRRDDRRRMELDA